MVRNVYIDIIRLVSNILIVLVHSGTLSVVLESKNASQCAKNATSFLCYNIGWSAMPTLFLISGYLMMRGFSLETYRHKIYTRLYRLVFPYLTWNFIYLMIFLGGVYYLNETMKHSLMFYILKIPGIATQPADTPLWYVRALLIFLFLLPLLWKMLMFLGVGFSIVITFFLVIVGEWLGYDVPLSINFPLYGIASFFIGCTFAYKEIDIIKVIKKMPYAYVIFGFVSLLFTPLLGEILPIKQLLITFQAFFWIGLLCCFPEGVMQVFAKKKIVSLLVSASFFIYASHRIIPNIFARLIKKSQLMGSSIGAAESIMLVIIEIGLIIGIILFAYKVLDKYFPRLLDVLSGRKMRKIEVRR